MEETGGISAGGGDDVEIYAVVENHEDLGDGHIAIIVIVGILQDETAAFTRNDARGSVSVGV